MAAHGSHTDPLEIAVVTAVGRYSGAYGGPIRDSLVQQLLAHRKQAAEELARRRAREQTQFSRMDGEFCEVAGPNEPEDSPFVSVWDLMQQARDLSRWVQEHRESHRQWKETLGVEKDDVTVSDMIDYLWTRFGSAETTLDGASLIHEQPTASRRASLFLGILELVRISSSKSNKENFVDQRGCSGVLARVLLRSSEMRRFRVRVASAFLD